MPKTPDIDLDRDEETATVTLRNREDVEARIYRADEYNDRLKFQSQIDADVFNDSGLDVDRRYKYAVTYEDIDISVNIVADNTDQEPPFYEAEPVGDTTFTDLTETFNLPWGVNVDADIIRVDNWQFGKPAITRFS